MAFIQYLIFDNVAIPRPDSYEVQLSDVEADSGGETEAGTTQRDIVRTGVAEILVSFSVSPSWMKRLTAFKNKASISVKYYDPETAAVNTAEMYIDGFKAKLVQDTSYGGLWSVSFTLKEF